MRNCSRFILQALIFGLFGNLIGRFGAHDQPPAAKEVVEDAEAVEEAPPELSPPTISAFLPNAGHSPRALSAAFKLSRHRTNVSIVIGIPTVKRESKNYLATTLNSILDNMNQEEMDDALVVVFVAESEPDAVQKVASELQSQFSVHLDSGLLEVISPHAEFYPNLNQLRQTLGDTMDRVVWRSKQVLDYAFVMMYAQSRGSYYLHLEDDVITKQGFFTSMKLFALEKDRSQPNWFLLNFCQLGSMGKLFRTSDLPHIVQYFLMFYNDQPVDWLMEDYCKERCCSREKDHRNCRTEIKKMWIDHSPSLFQHIGVQSSLKGKVQNLKDKNFIASPPAKPGSRNRSRKSH